MTASVQYYMSKAAEALDAANRIHSGRDVDIERARRLHAEADKWIELANLAERNGNPKRAD